LKIRLLTFLTLIVAALAFSSWPDLARCGQQAPTPGAAGSASDQRVVLAIGDEKLTAADIDFFLQSLPPRYQTFYSGPGKRLLPQYIIAMKALADEAVRDKLSEQPQTARALEFARQSVLSSFARRRIYDSVTVTDQDLHQLYEKDKTLSEEIRLRHILIQTQDAPLKDPVPGRSILSEPEARKKLEDIRSRISAGADFAAMAKQYSDDTATADAGGDLGILQREKVVPPITKAAESLAPGQVSDIIPTPSGLEIIQVEEKRTKPFEEVKSTLETQFRQQKASETIQHLSDAYRPVIDQEFFGGPASIQSSPPSSQ